MEHVGIESWVCSLGGKLRLREAMLLYAAFWEKTEKVVSAAWRFRAVC